MGRSRTSKYDAAVDGRRIPKPSYVSRLARQEMIESRRRNWKTNFLKAYAECGVITKACKLSGVDPSLFYKARRDDPEFAEAFELSHRAATDKVLEAVWQMGVDGEREPIVWQGEIVAYSRRRNFAATKFLLESMAPQQYSSRERVARIGMMTAQEIAIQREKMIEQVNARLDSFTRPALPSPEPIDVEVADEASE